MQRGVTVVSIDHKVAGCDRISLDNRSAMLRAVDHLASLGHRSIGMIAGPAAVISERERLIGYRRAMRLHRLPIERRLQVFTSGFSDKDGVAAARHMLAGTPRPTALIVASSALAPGVLAAAGEAGLRIPQDLAVLGVGEMSWSPALVSPITSLVEPAYEMGAAACRYLLERSSGEYSGPGRSFLYPARLAVRLSCGAPAEARDVPFRDGRSLLFASVHLA
jgi:LacI family transcriptional regulator